jgi:hypothetical protein
VVCLRRLGKLDGGDVGARARSRGNRPRQGTVQSAHEMTDRQFSISDAAKSVSFKPKLRRR